MGYSNLKSRVELLICQIKCIRYHNLKKSDFRDRRIQILCAILLKYGITNSTPESTLEYKLTNLNELNLTQQLGE